MNAPTGGGREEEVLVLVMMSLLSLHCCHLAAHEWQVLVVLVVCSGAGGRGHTGHTATAYKAAPWRGAVTALLVHTVYAAY